MEACPNDFGFVVVLDVIRIIQRSRLAAENLPYGFPIATPSSACERGQDYYEMILEAVSCIHERYAIKLKGLRRHVGESGHLASHTVWSIVD